MRLIVLEDDPVLAVVLADFLREEGHLVETATDMNHVAQLAISAEWDAGIVDPVVAGYVDVSASDALAFRNVGKHLPVVVITGRSWATRTSPTWLGVCEILPKPFDLAELARVLDRVANDGRCAKISAA